MSLTETATEQQAFIESLDDNPHLVTTIQVRDLPIHYWTPNSRLLIDCRKIPMVEPDLLDWIDTMPSNAVFYDVGASNGPFSTYAALKNLQVVAFEPEAQNFAVLEMNHYLNREKIQHPILPLNIALSDEAGVGKMYCRNYVAGYHMKMLDAPLRRMEDQQFEPSHIQPVLKNRLDDLIDCYALPVPQYMKVDVDGAEAKLLQGARKTLAHPDFKELFIEVVYPEDEAKGKPVISLIEGLGFEVVDRQQVENYEGLYNYLFRKK
jgi:FkbM family methyltransferase